MSKIQKQPKGNKPQKNQREEQGNRSQDSASQYGENTRSDLLDDRGDSDDDRRTGTSISGNTAGDSFNATAEQQQTDRDKNSEG